MARGASTASAASTAACRRVLCANHWPEIPPVENPVGYVTNGVHVPTFLSSVWAKFLDERLPQWRDRLSDAQYWKAVDELPDAAFWAAAQDVKSRMLGGVRARLEQEYRRKRPGFGAAAPHHALHRSG